MDKSKIKIINLDYDNLDLVEECVKSIEKDINRVELIFSEDQSMDNIFESHLKESKIINFIDLKKYVKSELGKCDLIFIMNLDIRLKYDNIGKVLKFIN